MFGLLGTLIFGGRCIAVASEKTLPANYHGSQKLEAEDAAKVSRGEMTRGQFVRNMNRGKYASNVDSWEELRAKERRELEDRYKCCKYGVPYYLRFWETPEENKKTYQQQRG